MGTITEANNFDATVYQWETTDPVTGGPGGIANTPLGNLANRTRWLYNQIAALNAEYATLAALNSPTFTGTPRAPTPGAGASGTELATTAWARGLKSSVASVTMSGDTTLSSVQAGAGILELFGSTPGDSYLLFPPGTGVWIISNGTTNRVRCRLASGGAYVTVATGAQKTVWCDGSAFSASMTDFESVTLSGSSQVNKPARGDRSNLIPNTTFVGDAVADEEAYRQAADTQIRVDVDAAYVRRSQAQADWLRSNFLPGDGFDVPATVGLTTGNTPGVVYITASLVHTFQTPNPTYLRLYFNSGMVIEEATYQSKSVQYAAHLAANTAYTFSAHTVTGGGGGWCQMSLAVGFIFVPS